MVQASSAKGTSMASPPSATAGQKRKRPTEKKFYAVKIGKQPGVYDSWEQCLAQVTGQKGASFKSFPSREDAQAFVEGKPTRDTSKIPGEQKFYAVQKGKIPGVYTDWPSAQAQISGFRNPKHKKFNTRAEAEAFINDGRQRPTHDSGAGLTPEEEIRRLIVRKSAPGMVPNADYIVKDKQGNTFELARGPLPSGAEDGYDPNIKLEPDGTIRNRTIGEKALTKRVPKEADPPGMLKIYTDGSSLSNGQVGARAGIGVYFGPAPFEYDSHSPNTNQATVSNSTSAASQREIPLYTMDWRERGAPPKKKKRKLTWRYRNISEALKGTKQTNQRAELTAIQRALEVAPSHRDVTIFTDSRYSIDCVTNWYKSWQRNGWLNSKGRPVENKDLVQEIREKIDERDGFAKQTLFVWVKGHAADKGNIEADRLAVAGARKGLTADTNKLTNGHEDMSLDGHDTSADDAVRGRNSGEDEDEDEDDDEEGNGDGDEASGDSHSETGTYDDPEVEAAFQLRKEALEAEESSALG